MTGIKRQVIFSYLEKYSYSILLIFRCPVSIISVKLFSSWRKVSPRIPQCRRNYLAFHKMFELKNRLPDRWTVLLRKHILYCTRHFTSFNCETFRVFLNKQTEECHDRIFRLTVEPPLTDRILTTRRTFEELIKTINNAKMHVTRLRDFDWAEAGKLHILIGKWSCP